MKFDPGDIIHFRGKDWKVLLQAKIGWEGQEKAMFYDVKDLETGELNAFHIDEVDNGIQLVYTSDYQTVAETTVVVKPATLVRKK